MDRFKIFALMIVGLAVLSGCSKRPEKSVLAPEAVNSEWVIVQTDPAGAKVAKESGQVLVAATPDSFKFESAVVAIISLPSHYDSLVAFTEPGEYMFKLRAVEVDTATPPDTTKIDTTLAPGYLVVNANQTTTGATVFVNGDSLGVVNTPEFRDTLAVGYYNLKISRQGYQDFTALAQIESEKPTVYDPTLVALPPGYGTLAVISSHFVTQAYLPGVDVYLRHQGVDTPWPSENNNKTQIDPTHMEPGTYMVVGKMEGFVESTTTVTVGAGANEIAYLVMHPVEDDDFGPGPQCDLYTQSQDGNLYIWGTAVGETADKYCWVIADGGVSALTVIKLDTVKYEAEKFVLPYTYFPDDQNRFTLAFGQGHPMDNPGNWLWFKDGTSRFGEYPHFLSGTRPDSEMPEQWIEFDRVYASPTDAWVDLRITPSNCTIDMDGQLWSEGVTWISPGSHSVTVSKSGYLSQTKQFTAVVGDTALVVVDLVEETPLSNPLRVEYSDSKVRLYGDGHADWLGLELYDPDQNESTGWIVNHWVKGLDKGDYIEFEIPDSRLDRCVIWHDCTPGLEGSGGSGVSPRFLDWANLQSGTGIDYINTSPGYFVIAH